MFDDDFDFWDDEPSHWFRKLVFLGLGAVAAYFYAQHKAKQSEMEAPAMAGGWQRLSSSEPAEPKPSAPEPVVDVTEPEIIHEYVMVEDEIGEDDEIDLALEEEIEAGDIDEDDLVDNDEFETMLTESGVDADEESVLEPSPASESPKWVAPVNGECPEGYPVKARFSTGRFHVPGDRGYDKIFPDCCYENIDDAEADGFTHSRWS